MDLLSAMNLIDPVFSAMKNILVLRNSWLSYH